MTQMIKWVKKNNHQNMRKSAKIADMWHLCETDDKIAEEINLERSGVSKKIKSYVQNGISAGEFEEYDEIAKNRHVPEIGNPPKHAKVRRFGAFVQTGLAHSYKPLCRVPANPINTQYTTPRTKKKSRA